MDLLLYFFAQLAACAQEPFLWLAALGGYVLKRHNTVVVVGGAGLALILTFFFTPVPGQGALQNDLFWAARAVAGAVLGGLGLLIAEWGALCAPLRALGKRCGAMWTLLKRRCPICAERVQADTSRCLYCGYLFTEAEE